MAHVLFSFTKPIFVPLLICLAKIVFSFQNSIIMQKYILVGLALFFTLNLKAQHIEPCATPPVKSEWLKSYQANPDAYAKGSDTTIYVPVTVHVVGTDVGTGYYPVEDIFNTFCQLNVDFEPLNIRFYIEGDLNYINNSLWYTHDNFNDGTEMMELNRVPGTFNCYIVETAAGAGGYYNPLPDAVALTIGNLNLPTWHTWAHEAGHYFTLMHTFLGWEGIDYNFNDPTPESVSGWGLPIPVERMDGSNCLEAADGFCDTPPDYLSSIFGCDSMGFSFRLQKDPDSIFFRSDGGNFMSYSNGICNSYFSAEQEGAIRANLINDRQDLLTNQTVIDVPVTDLSTLLEPTQDEIVTAAPTLRWTSVENANRYYYEVNRSAGFSPSLRVKEAIVMDTFVVVDDLGNNANYYWRVRPLNTTYPCEGEYSTSSFMTGELVGSEGVAALNDLVLYPNILSVGQAARLEMNLDSPIDVSVRLLDVNGRQVSTIFEGQVNGIFSQEIDTQLFSTGLYWVVVEANGALVQKKLMVF